MEYLTTMEKYILLDKVYFLVNLNSYHARILKPAIQENIRSVEFVSVIGREEGYTVKYTPPPEEVPEGEGHDLLLFHVCSPFADQFRQYLLSGCIWLRPM